LDAYGVSQKIQAICNRKCVPITTQGLAHSSEKPVAQGQWETMEKQCEEQWNVGMQARAYIGVAPDADDGMRASVVAYTA
jgi:hypothetical protein